MKGKIIIIIIIIISEALSGPRPPQGSVVSDLYPGLPPANFYNPVSSCLPLPRQSILISVGHVLVDLQGSSTISFSVIRCHPFALHGQPTSVYWILLIHCKAFPVLCCIARAERDGTRAETRFRLSQKRTSPFKSVGASVQSTAGSRGVRISLSNAG